MTLLVTALITEFRRRKLGIILKTEQISQSCPILSTSQDYRKIASFQ
jgi:hypothetical protein